MGGAEETSSFSVEFALNVEGRGLVVLCKFPHPPSVRIRVGDPLEFVRPDGSSLHTTIKALDMVMDARPGLLGLCLPAEVSKDDIPYGSKVRMAHSKN